MQDKIAEKKTEYVKVRKIFNGSDLLRATIQYDLLNYISEQLPLRVDILISRISVFFYHNTKWCRKKIRHFADIGLIEPENRDFSVSIIHATDNLKKYLKDLKRNIRKYEKIVEKERKEHEEWLKEHSNRLLSIEEMEYEEK